MEMACSQLSEDIQYIIYSFNTPTGTQIRCRITIEKQMCATFAHLFWRTFGSTTTAQFKNCGVNVTQGSLFTSAKHKIQTVVEGERERVSIGDGNVVVGDLFLLPGDNVRGVCDDSAAVAAIPCLTHVAGFAPSLAPAVLHDPVVAVDRIAPVPDRQHAMVEVLGPIAALRIVVDAASVQLEL